jgi:hypothetical protein
MRSAITPQGRGQNYGRKKRKVLRLIVGSPGDMRAEREAVHRVRRAEPDRGARRGLVLEAGGWDTDAYPGFHPERLMPNFFGGSNLTYW